MSGDGAGGAADDWEVGDGRDCVGGDGELLDVVAVGETVVAEDVSSFQSFWTICWEWVVDKIRIPCRATTFARAPDTTAVYALLITKSAAFLAYCGECSNWLQ